MDVMTGRQLLAAQQLPQQGTGPAQKALIVC
jgi:hypothetical protein